MPHRISFLAIIIIGLISFITSGSVFAQEEVPQQTLFKNVNIFNGTDDRLYENHSVLVEGNIIKAISASEIKTNATVIDGGGVGKNGGLIRFTRMHD